MIDNNLTENRKSSENSGFISKPQFLAVKYHFENVFVRIKDNEHLKEMAAEFSNILGMFQTCFAESERKTHKILELKALNVAKSQAIQSLRTVPDETLEDLKKKVKTLQVYIDKTNEENLTHLKEIENLKKIVETQDKMIQVHERSFENVPVEIGSDRTSFESKLRKKKPQRKDSSEEDHLDEELKAKDESGKLVATFLKNNLEVLVLNLKVARLKIEQLKKEIVQKDARVSQLGKKVNETEKMLAEAETRNSEVRKPMETKVANYKTELNIKRERVQVISEELEKARLRNKQLSVDIASKEFIIDDLKAKLEAVESDKESAARSSETFERHLGKSQNYNKELIWEIEILKDEIRVLKKQVSKAFKTDKLDSEKELKEEVNSQERTIDSLKNHIILHDQKLRQTEQELNSTVELLQNLKRDFSGVRKEKSHLRSEITHLKNMIHDKTADVKYFKEKLGQIGKESQELERELHSFERKHQKVVDKKNEFHSMYNQMKFLNSQQKKENAVLGKRQEYLVKILKEKKVQKMITRGRFIC